MERPGLDASRLDRLLLWAGLAADALALAQIVLDSPLCDGLAPVRRWRYTLARCRRYLRSGRRRRRGSP